MNLFYIIFSYSVPTSKETYFDSVIETNWFTQFSKIIGVYSKKMLSLSMLNHVVYIVTVL
jgi:hypothetical protein